MKTPNQIDRQLDDLEVTADDLLKVPDGTITEDGLRMNIRVGSSTWRPGWAATAASPCTT